MTTAVPRLGAEVLDDLERFGRRPLAVLDEMGWIAQDVWAAQGIHFDDAEVRRLGETGTVVARCPSSNCRLGSGIAGVVDLVAAGAPVGVGWGRDGQQRDRRDRRAASRAAHGPVPGPSARPELDHLPASRRLRPATESGARCLGRDDAGRLEPGFRADVVVWPGDDLADVLDPLAGLVLGPERRARHVPVEGEYVVGDGRLLGADMDALRRDLARQARRLRPEEAR